MSHEWVEIRRVEWDTEFPDLDEQNETVIYECSREGCSGMLWRREARTLSLKEWV